MNKTKWIPYLGCSMAALMLTGCLSLPKKEVVKPDTVMLSAQNNINPDARGRASPVAVRMCELKSLSTFSGADFFSLYEKGKETLGTELLGCDEYFLRPGEQQTVKHKVQPETQYVVVLAAFRDIERALWRASTYVGGGGKLLNVTVDANKIDIKVQ